MMLMHNIKDEEEEQEEEEEWDHSWLIWFLINNYPSPINIKLIDMRALDEGSNIGWDLLFVGLFWCMIKSDN